MCLQSQVCSGQGSSAGQLSRAAEAPANTEGREASPLGRGQVSLWSVAPNPDSVGLAGAWGALCFPVSPGDSHARPGGEAPAFSEAPFTAPGSPSRPQVRKSSLGSALIFRPCNATLPPPYPWRPPAGASCRGLYGLLSCAAAWVGPQGEQLFFLLPQAAGMALGGAWQYGDSAQTQRQAKQQAGWRSPSAALLLGLDGSASRARPLQRLPFLCTPFPPRSTTQK